MRKLIGGILLCVTPYVTASEFSSYEWGINDAGVSVVIEANSYNKFAVVAKCSGENMLFLYDVNSYKPSSVGKALRIKVRVDRGKIYDTYGTLMEDNDSVALHVNDAHPIVDDMRRGQTMRVAFKIDGQDEFGIIEKYTLRGLTSAMNRSTEQCGSNESLEYFPDDGDFF
jgi:hypothetical protein